MDPGSSTRQTVCSRSPVPNRRSGAPSVVASTIFRMSSSARNINATRVERAPRRARCKPERVNALGLHPFVSEDAAVDEGLRRDLTDDPGLLVVVGSQPVDIEGGFGELLEEPGAEQPIQSCRVRLVEHLGIHLLTVHRILRRPRHVQPGIGAFGQDRGAFLARQRVVHRGNDVLGPLSPNDPSGERVEGAHAFESRNAAMYPTSASTPSSVIAL